MTLLDHAYAEEHDLVEAYLQDRLSDSEREAFEAHYFACEACLEQLEAASEFRAGMLEVAAETIAEAAAARAGLGLLAGLARLSRGRRLALAAALLLLLALPLGLLLANRGLERQVEVARSTAAAAAQQRTAGLEARLRTLQGDAAGARRELESALAKERGADPQVNLSLFTLAAVRSGDDGREPVNRLALTAATPAVVLSLELAAIDYPSYRASLRNASGGEIWQAAGLRPDSRDALVLLLPARLLPPGLYRLIIAGSKGAAPEQIVAAYPFRVVPAR